MTNSATSTSHNPSMSTTYIDTTSETLKKLPSETINSSIPKHITMTTDFINQSTGFYNTKTLLKYFNQLSKPTVSISTIDKEHTIDEGMAATMQSRKRNNTPLPPPKQYSHTWHMDIGFGPTTAIGGIRYTLMLVDKATRTKRMYGLKNLTTSLHQAIHQFLAEAGVKPTMIRTDFDSKLMAGTVHQILTEKGIRIESAPPKRQHQNGLVERNWRSAVTMARNWLKSSMLPAKYWWFAIKRAIEISNIMPTKYGNTISTPYENLYGDKVDYRQLFPMFSTSYIKRETDVGSNHKNKFQSESIKVICVGTCPKSDSLLFYHPASK